MEDQTERAIQAGNAAKQLLETPVLVEAFEQIEREAFDHWVSSPGSATEARERLYLGVCAVRKLRETLSAKVAAGMAAAANLEAEKMNREFEQLNRTPGELT